ncbi:ERO1LB [Cordylochernes scorpioides]|uniref:ERO1LB n=1 Tax=Cordylochernes scorpioides TaxID=51811 RepID=A0ABY6LD07_9ARAC|nr:ERO1LB [Cordylochernes scorpioides]
MLLPKCHIQFIYLDSSSSLLWCSPLTRMVLLLLTVLTALFTLGSSTLLSGQIDDCVCTADAVDDLNNEVYPLLKQLLERDYFRYFKDQDSVDCDENHGGLGSIDPTLSDQNYEDFVKWQDHDDAQVNFCELDDENSKDLDYVDLLPNPERFTGYKGKSAHRIWKSVYEENSMCFEKRVFYRAVSGLHSSINIHLCSDYFFPPKRKDQPTVSTNTPWSMAKEPSVMYHGKGGHWGPNVEEFLRRFDPKGPGLQYIMNLYFIYLLELRALAKAAPLLASESYFTGNLEEDVRVKEQVTQLLDLARKFPFHFDERVMFAKDDPQSIKLKDQDSVDCDENHGGLGSIDPTLSDQNYEDFVKWQDHDDAQVNFCELDDENSKDLDYVDLLPNPERFTGYKGKSAHRIWKSVYEENSMCFEKRVFYRAVSGLHSSINIHLCSDYFFPPKRKDQPTVSTNTPWSMAKEPSVMYHGKGGHWGPNVEEFLRRFDPKGPGLQYIMNLYFIYLLELRALAKAAPLLASESYFTGNLEEDVRVKEQVTQLLDLARKFPFHFDERVMFAKDDPQSIKLKEEFRAHFHNISRIMKCVGCDKCRLWGRLQIQGLGTAFKILFFGGSGAELDLEEVRQKRFRLTRTELVSLFNAFGRLSNSIHQLGVFNELILQNRTLLKDKPPQSSSQPKLEL